MELKSITIKDNEEFLRMISKEVDIKNDKDLKKDIDILHKYCTLNDVMAMAAVQLGILKRIVYLKNTNLELINKYQTNSETFDEKNYNEERILINPVVKKKEGLTEYWEACASCLDFCGKVLRPYKLIVEYYDINGQKKEEIFVGFEATVLSHELDHLDGILHIDKSLELKEITKEERKLLRQKEGYKIYYENGNYEKLKEEYYEKSKN